MVFANIFHFQTQSSAATLRLKNCPGTRVLLREQEGYARWLSCWHKVIRLRVNRAKLHAIISPLPLFKQTVYCSMAVWVDHNSMQNKFKWRRKSLATIKRGRVIFFFWFDIFSPWKLHETRIRNIPVNSSPILRVGFVGRSISDTHFEKLPTNAWRRTSFGDLWSFTNFFC